MPGAIAGTLYGPQAGEDGGVFLLRSANAAGQSAVVDGSANAPFAGTADLRGCVGPYGLLTMEVIGTPTATARLLLVLDARNGWPSAVITAMVVTAAGIKTALLTGRYPFLVGELQAKVAGATANLHLSWS